MYSENDFRAAEANLQSNTQGAKYPADWVAKPEDIRDGVYAGQTPYYPPSQTAPQMSLQNMTEVTNSEPKVTSIMDLQRYARGTIVELPGFAEGQPFVARLVRPSMLVLAKKGKIPNTLLTSANELFAKGSSAADVDDEAMLKNMCEVMEVICEAAMVEPTLKAVHDAGLELSDDQLMAIFTYTQVGVKALDSFR